jgi:hypothetical protein
VFVTEFLSAIDALVHVSMRILGTNSRMVFTWMIGSDRENRGEIGRHRMAKRTPRPTRK